VYCIRLHGVARRAPSNAGKLLRILTAYSCTSSTSGGSGDFVLLGGGVVAGLIG
jgi:hypothetical protein